MVNKVIKSAVIAFDSNGVPNIIIDGRTYSGFSAASNYGSYGIKNGSVVVQIEIDAGDYSRGNALPAYTVFHHLDGSRKAVSSHS